MRLPRDLSAADLIKALGRLGYEPTRQVGSHIRLTKPGRQEHHVTVPDHKSIKPGTLNSIMRDIATHLGLTRDKLMEKLFR